MRVDAKLLDEIAALAEQAWENYDPEGFQFTIKSASGNCDVRAYAQMLLLLHPSIVLNLIDDARENSSLNAPRKGGE